MKFLAASLMLLLLATSAYAGQLLNSISQKLPHALRCSEPTKQVSATWTNNLGPIYVTQGDVWIGEDMRGRSDTAFSLTVNDGRLLKASNWDHYAEPSGINDNVASFNFGPNSMLLEPGQSVTLTLICTGPYSAVPTKVNGMFILWYATTQP